MRRQRPDLRRDCDTLGWMIVSILPSGTTKTWFTKGLRLFCYVRCYLRDSDDKDLIYEGIATSRSSVICTDIWLSTTKTWFTKGLRLVLVDNQYTLHFRRQRPDLRRDCDCEFWRLNWSLPHCPDDKDLIYEGIATKLPLFIFSPLFGRQRPDLRRDCDFIFFLLAFICLLLRRQRPDLRRDCDPSLTPPYSMFSPRRQRPDLRRDCDQTSISPLHWYCFRRQRPDLRRDCDAAPKTGFFGFH